MIFSGVTILQGVEFPIFPIDFAWALQQCSATALPVIITPRLYSEHPLVCLRTLIRCSSFIPCRKHIDHISTPVFLCLQGALPSAFSKDMPVSFKSCLTASIQFVRGQCSPPNARLVSAVYHRPPQRRVQTICLLSLITSSSLCRAVLSLTFSFRTLSFQEMPGIRR